MAIVNRTFLLILLAALAACGGGDYQPANGDPCSAQGSVGGWVAGVIVEGVCRPSN